MYVNDIQISSTATPFYHQALTNDTVRFLLFDEANVQTLYWYLGEDPIHSNKKYIMRYLKDNSENRNQKHRKAVDEINKRDTRVKRLSSFLSIPSTWNKICDDFVDFKLFTIKFNDNFTEAEVEYKFCSSGGHILLKRKSGSWIKVKTITSWIH